VLWIEPQVKPIRNKPPRAQAAPPSVKIAERLSSSGCAAFFQTEGTARWHLVRFFRGNFFARVPCCLVESRIHEVAGGARCGICADGAAGFALIYYLSKNAGKSSGRIRGEHRVTFAGVSSSTCHDLVYSAAKFAPLAFPSAKPSRPIARLGFPAAA